MALLLRKLDKKAFWDQAAEKGLCALDAGPEVLRDVSDSALSVYRLEDGNANLGRVVAAFCAKRNVLSNFDYVLVPEEGVQTIAPVVNTEGNTNDADVNACHRDVENLTVWNAVLLVECILPMERARFLPREVEELLRESLEQGWLKIEDLNKGIRGKFAA